MKCISIVFLLSCFEMVLTAQNYSYDSSLGTSPPFIYNAPGTTILGIPSSDVLSSVQTVPFNWSYYGIPVNGYKISDNGYITFDTSSTISSPLNTIIPASGGPNNAIYAFWDDLEIVSGTGSVDEALTYTYGTAPNRVHVIQWFSVTPAIGSGFLYTAIRLHECGDFDIIHNYGNALGMTATIGCEDATGTNGVMVDGPTATFPSLNNGSEDDEVYTFSWGGIDYDLSITNTTIDNMIPIGMNTISGEIANKGSIAITSYDLSYSLDGGTPVTETVTGVNIPANSNSTYSHSVQLNIPTGGENHTICVWTNNPNGNLDERSCNDEYCKDVLSGLGISVSQINVVIEELTGAWCGFCVDGAVILSEIIDDSPNNIIPVSIHTGDDMEYNDGVITAFASGSYPNAMINRLVFAGEAVESHSRGNWAANTLTALANTSPVEVDISNTYDPSTRTITATVNANFVDYAQGDLRIVFAVIEDSVSGSGSGYDQVNYSNQTSGHPFEGAGDPIVGYVHKHVLRANPAGAFGNAGIIPSPVSPGVYSETFTYVIPTNFNENNISLVGFVAQNSTVVGERAILNGAQKHLFELNTAITLQKELFAAFDVFPNPVINEAIINFELLENTSADIVIYNHLGQEVSLIQSANFVAGKHQISANVSDLASGLYYITLRTANNAITKKLIRK